ncbi:MAG TPA: ribosome small subunit-dependent GTPase A [Candidatus Binatia bacterium]|nr:ribosome small subunit-dependent GTPase A [Candidatus Binatia bacterium]
MSLARRRGYAPAIVPTTPTTARPTVLQVYGVTALIWDGQTIREATLATRLKADADPSLSSSLAVGDEVALEEGSPPRIVSVAPRRTRLERAATGSRGRELTQVIAANADQTVIVSSFDDPPFRPGLIDRWTLLALRGGMEPVLCLNKVDLASTEAARRVVLEANIPLETIYVSAKTDEGLETLRAQLAGRSTVFVGHSGVGKSSLLRRLIPDAEAATGELSERTRKGKHTTTSSRLYPLPEGGLLIDTPGVRSVVLGRTSADEVAGVFGEIAHAPPCRFRPCTHRTEPGCAVLAGLQSGAVPRAVYQRYRKLLEEVELP